jgi:hypothetical protein
LTYYIPTGATTSTQYTDALADGPTCERDISNMLDLGVNALQILYVNPSLDHSACMNALADASIYVFVTLGVPGNDVGLSPSTRWNTDMLDQYTAGVDSLAHYTNTLAFSIGELPMWTDYECHTGCKTVDSERLVTFKAAVRDVKQHIRDKGFRDIPLGYISLDSDNSTWTQGVAQYLTCDEHRPDFLAMPATAHCNGSDEDAVKEVTQKFGNAPIPVFGVNTGCQLYDNTTNGFELNPSASRPTKSNDTRSYDYLTNFYPDGYKQGLNGAFVLGYVDNEAPPIYPYGKVSMTATPAHWLL